MPLTLSTSGLISSTFREQSGSVFKVVAEFEFEKLVIDDATPFSQGGYPNYGETSQPDFFPFIVPGTSTMDILKEIE